MAGIKCLHLMLFLSSFLRSSGFSIDIIGWGDRMGSMLFFPVIPGLNGNPFHISPVA